jgi:uncharacterized membrane protein YoaK (UPF0700 family)
MSDQERAADFRLRDRLLDALTISSGAFDAISFIAFGRVFTAFMTGNIVFLGVRLAGSTSVPGPVPLVAAIAGFAIGVYVATRIVRRARDAGMWPREVTLALGTSLIFHVGALVVWFAVNGRPSTNTVPVLLAFWGLAMGMQSAAVRALHVDAVFTTAATATVIFLAGDVASWTTTGAERGRLVRILLSLFVGAAAGGLLLMRGHIYAPVLPFVITAAVVVTAALSSRERHHLAGEPQQHRGLGSVR